MNYKLGKMYALDSRVLQFFMTKSNDVKNLLLPIFLENFRNVLVTSWVTSKLIAERILFFFLLVLLCHNKTFFSTLVSKSVF